MVKSNNNEKLSLDDELNYIITINELLENYENTINLIFKCKNYNEIVINGLEIIKLIIELILKKEGFSVTKNTPLIKYAITTNIMPQIYRQELLNINRVNNKAQSEDIPYKETYHFLKSFDNFVIWSNDYYALDEVNNKFNIYNCSILIKMLSEEEKSDIELKTNLSNNSLSSTEELYMINKINESIKKFETHLDLMSQDNYSGAVIAGHIVCVEMLELLLKKEGYEVEKGKVNNNGHYTPIIAFSSRLPILPKTCQDCLNSIKRYRNEFVHLNPSYDLAKSFLNVLKYFILWFNNFYSDMYGFKPFKLNECCFKIDSIIKPKNINLENLANDNFSTSNQLNREFVYKQYLATTFDNANSNQIIHQLLLTLTEFREKLDEIEKTSKNIESKLDDIYEKITEQISSYQSLIEKQINRANSKEDEEAIISGFIDQCAEKFIEENSKITEDKLYKLEKQKLINSMGENAWEKLSNNSKSYLISSKVTYNNFILNENNDLDYSGVCVLVTKTLEDELNKRFFTNFIKYLDKNYNKDYSKYPTPLLYKKKEPLNYEKFNMGKIAFVMCYYEDKYANKKQKKNNKEKLMEYCKTCVFSKYNDKEIRILLKTYAKSIEEIRVKYRNKSAHPGEIKQIDAEACFDLVLDIEKLLKKMLDSFDT